MNTTSQMKRPLFACGCCYIAAATACFYLGPPVALSLAAPMAAGGLLFYKAHRRAAAIFFLSALLAVGISVGYMALRVRPVAGLAGQRCDVQLTVTRVESYGRRITGEGVARLTLSNGQVLERVGVRFVGYGDTDPAVGTCLDLPGAQMSPVGTLADTVRHHLADGRYIAVELPGIYTLEDEPVHALDARLACFRETVSEVLIRSLGGDAGALFGAMLTGDTRALSGEAMHWLRGSGLVHLTAVSGLHITLAAGAPLFMFRGRNRRWGLLSGICLALGYAALAGFSSSSLRALIMFLMMALAELASRRADGLTSLAVAGVLICAVNPLAVGSLGFQLSFLATLGILLVSGPARGVLEDMATARLGGVGILEIPIASLSVSLGATLFTAPLSALVFGYLPMLGFVANLMVTALLPAVLLLAALAAAAGLWLPAMAGLVAPVVRLAGGYVLGTARFVSGLPFAVLPVYRGYQVALLFALALLVAVVVSRKPGYRVITALALCILLAAGTTFLGQHALYGDRIEVITLEESGGIVFARGRQAMVFGLPEGSYAVDRVGDMLLRRGVREVVLVTGERAQAVRLLADRLPVDLCYTGDNLHPVGVREAIPPGDWEVSAFGITAQLDAEGAVWIDGEKLLPQI